MTVSKRKKEIKKILDALNEKAPLSTDRGKYISKKYKKPTTKQRRHRGWGTPRIFKPMMKFSEITKNALEPQIEYDNWNDFRDGMRDTRDLKRIIPVKEGRWWWDFSEEEVREHNKKIKKQRAIIKIKHERKSKTNN